MGEYVAAPLLRGDAGRSCGGREFGQMQEVRSARCAVKALDLTRRAGEHLRVGGGERLVHVRPTRSSASSRTGLLRHRLALHGDGKKNGGILESREAVACIGDHQQVT